MAKTSTKSTSKKSAAEVMHFRVDGDVNLCVPWYLMACYAYYVLDDPFMSDQDFDWLAKKTLDEWDSITHRHKVFLNKDILRAGTQPISYPQIVAGATFDIMKG